MTASFLPRFLNQGPGSLAKSAEVQEYEAHLPLTLVLTLSLMGVDPVCVPTSFSPSRTSFQRQVLPKVFLAGL